MHTEFRWGKAAIWKSRRRCEYNSMMDLTEIKHEDARRMILAQDYVHCWDSVLAMLKFMFLLTEG
jgi:hypothetical protein